MKETYVSYEVAKLLKKMGFDWDIRQYYALDSKTNVWELEYDDNEGNYNIYGENLISAPTQQMACRWLSEVHNVDIWVRPQTGILGVKGYTPYITTYKLRTKGHMYYHEDAPDRYDSKDHFIPVPDDKGLIPAHQHYSKHEDALEAALQYCLTNLI